MENLSLVLFLELLRTLTNQLWTWFCWLYPLTWCLLLGGNKEETTLRESFCVKFSAFEVFLVRIFLYSDWIRRDTPYLSVFSPNAGKYGTEKLPIQTIFMQYNKASNYLYSFVHNSYCYLRLYIQYIYGIKELIWFSTRLCKSHYFNQRILNPNNLKCYQ